MAVLYTIVDRFRSGQPLNLFDSALFFGGSVATVVFSSTFGLFWITANAASTILAVLNERIVEKSSADLSELFAWKDHHELACKLIQSINGCFGPFILISVCHGFVTFVTNAYQSATLLGGSSPQAAGFTFFFLFIYEFVVLFILVYACHRVQAEVIFIFIDPFNLI